MWAMAPASAAIRLSASATSVNTSAALRSAARAKPPLRCADTALSRQNEKSAKPAYSSDFGCRARNRRRTRGSSQVPCDLDESPENGEPGMGQGVALARGGQQYRSAAVLFQIGRMGREPGDEDQRRPSISVATLTREAKGCPVLRSMVASEPARVARNRAFATDFGSKSEGAVAFSGSRFGMFRAALALVRYRLSPLDSIPGIPDLCHSTSFNCLDFALSRHTSAPTWALKGTRGRADAAADSC